MTDELVRDTLFSVMFGEDMSLEGGIKKSGLDITTSDALAALGGLNLNRCVECGTWRYADECPTCDEADYAPAGDGLVTCPDCGGDGLETCYNPDHTFVIETRLGCPGCGHDPRHKTGEGKCPTCGGSGMVTPEAAVEYKEGDYEQ